MEIVTPSYRPDFESFELLHASIRKFCTASSVQHHVVVPPCDVSRFKSIKSQNLSVHNLREFLPQGLLHIGDITRKFHIEKLRKVQALDPVNPIFPIRGWIIQQMVKFAVAAQATSSTVISVDSDVAFIRPFNGSTFEGAERARLYRSASSIDRLMTRHVEWHSRARKVLGLDGVVVLPAHDYIAAVVAWDTNVLRAMLARMQMVESRSWQEAILSSRHFSECITYGTYVEAFHPRGVETTTDSYCCSYWDALELNERSAARLLESVRPSDVAIQIQSTSRTPIWLRRKIVQMAQSH